jgi:hypothetical protein
MKEVAINCKTKDVIPLEKITPFQGGLKFREEQDIKKIKKSLIEYGISFPFFVWEKDDTIHCLDGHGRQLALMELQQEGYTLPLIPVVFIHAENEEDAKQRILRLNSRYGMVTKYSVLQFVGNIEVNYDDLAIPDQANMFFDAPVKDVDCFFNDVPEEERRKKSIKICPHCGRALP